MNEIDQLSTVPEKFTAWMNFLYATLGEIDAIASLHDVDTNTSAEVVIRNCVRSMFAASCETDESIDELDNALNTAEAVEAQVKENSTSRRKLLDMFDEQKPSLAEKAVEVVLDDPSCPELLRKKENAVRFRRVALLTERILSSYFADEQVR